MDKIKEDKKQNKKENKNEEVSLQKSEIDNHYEKQKAELSELLNHRQFEMNEWMDNIIAEKEHLLDQSEKKINHEHEKRHYYENYYNKRWFF